VIVFAAPGSGKSFIIQSLLVGRGFVELDQDIFRTSFSKWMAKNRAKVLHRFGEKDGNLLWQIAVKQNIRGEKLSPEENSFLKQKVDETGLYDKWMTTFLTNKNPLTLPNVVVHSAGKSWEKIDKIANTLVEEAGYLPKNVHLVFVEAPKKTAGERNAARTRSVPSQDLEKYQQAAARTFRALMERPPRNIRGKFIRVLNSRTFTSAADARENAQFIIER
jgi:hypothetical protein